MSGRLFHLVPARDWQAFLRDGRPAWRPPSLGREGFTHLSFAVQLAGTLEAHFAGRAELVLVEVDRLSAADALHLEPGRDLELFPHLYRALRREEVLGTWRLVRGAEGWGLPRLGPEPAGDLPPGEPLPAPERAGPG